MPSNLISISDLFKSSIKLMQDNYKALWMWLAAVAVIQFVVTFWTGTQVPQLAMGDSSSSGMFFGMVFILSLASALITINLMRLLLAKALPSAKIAAYWTAVLFLIAAAIITAVLVGLASLVFILPGIWLGVSFMFSSLEIMANGKGPWTAMTSSFALVKGRWWAVFGRFVIELLIILALEIAGSIVFGIVGMVVGVIGVQMVTMAINGILAALLATAVAYFTLCWNINIYRSLKTTTAPVAPKAS